ncbi:Uncharacterised protein [Rikenella microfusus]|uniref:Uncharacterized protein n=2 Tax=Rikenella microfusus TaxID=28139 RepID=A0A379NEV1_9BACT|nr:Uncharacterised protein [Rikenella microfusus]
MSANGPCRPSRLTWKPMKKAGIRLQPGPKTASGACCTTRGRKKKIQERPLADYLDHENKEVVLHHIRDFISVNTSAIHQALPFYVLKELGLVAGMHTAKEYSMGMTLQFTDLPSLKSESAIRQSVGFLRTAKHVIKDGKDQMAPLIESDENRELFQKLAQAISNIPGTATMAIAEK